jgi:hypothetical protein
MTSSQQIYEVRPRKDHRGFDLISDALPLGECTLTKFEPRKNKRCRSDHRCKRIRAVLQSIT